MNSIAPGWYPNPEDATQVRYWDGTQWTPATAPAVAPQPAAVTAPTVQMAPPPLHTPTSPVAPPPYVPVASEAPAGPGASTKKKWLLGGAIAAGVIVVGSVGAALGSGNRTDATPSAAPVAEVASPTPVAAETVEAPVPTPTQITPAVEVADPVAFKAQANSHLDDMLKDLDDIVTTVNEDGFWRLLSNSGELAFNQGQLEVLEVPSNLTTAWPDSLTKLQGSLDVLTEAIGTQDGPSILAGVETVRAQVETTRGVVNTAQ